jgi:hypothetical protein
VPSTETWLAHNNPIPADAYLLLHRSLQAHIAALLKGHASYERVQRYFGLRAMHPGACKQDLLPLLVYTALSPNVYTVALPLTAAWALYLAAAHIMDEAQDTGSFSGANDSIIVLSAANKALAELDTDIDTLRDVLAAFGEGTMISGGAQKGELSHGRSWSREMYFRYIGGKSAAIIAVGAWLGGRLATDDDDTLALLKSFGLALGMILQIGDDCQDLAEDLVQGTFTLPVIEGLSMIDHQDYPRVQELTGKSPLSVQEAHKLVTTLTHMGAVLACQRLMRVYQVQAAAAFQVIPGLAAHFADYVMPEVP